MTLRRLFHFLAEIYGHAFRLLPRRRRYAAAHRLAKMIAPIVRRTPHYAQRPSKLDGYGEESLRMVLRMLARARVPFDPDVDVNGRDLVPDGPVIVVSGHFTLNVHMSRWMYEAGRTFNPVTAAKREPMYYSGTLHELDLIYKGPTLFVALRERLAAGHIVFVTIEHFRERADQTVIETAGGRRWVFDSTLKFAEKIGVPVVFGATRIGERGRLTVNYARPSANDAPTMLREFCAFLVAEAASIQR